MSKQLEALQLAHTDEREKAGQFTHLPQSTRKALWANFPFDGKEQADLWKSHIWLIYTGFLEDVLFKQQPRRQDPLLTNLVSSKAQYNAFGGHAEEPSLHNKTRKGLVFDNKHGLLRGFFNQPKPATESLISTTYKWRDVPFPMA